MKEERPVSTDDMNDLTDEEIASAKRRTRINALMLVAVLLLVTFAPHPWSILAPLLFLLPLLFSSLEKLRRRLRNPDGGTVPDSGHRTPGEPYAVTPRDPDDPRRYRPIE